jgi:uncharacterized protein (TIGR02996 family)
MRSFQYSDAKSHKFWNIDVQGSSFTVTFGKVGSAGQSQTKTFPSPEKAQAEADKLIREKTAKGYTETTPRDAASEAEALEEAVRSDPHDRAAHSALADWLAEHGEPRGEFMQAQLALEDESVPSARRKQLQSREKALLKKHEKDWVGSWADLIPTPRERDGYGNPNPIGARSYAFEGGLLTSLSIDRLTVPVARAVVAAPELRLVRNLYVGYVPGEPDPGSGEEFEPGPDIPEGVDYYHGQYPLLRWPQLRFIRRFYWGWPVPEEPGEGSGEFYYSCGMRGDRVYDFVKQMPDVEELRICAHVRDASKLMAMPMPNLRVFQLYHGWSYPLEKLAANKSVANLTHLLCHPHALEHDDEPYIRLKQLRAICRAPHLTKLTHLCLRNSDVGDAGAKEIAESGILKRLRVLELQLGCISDKGAKALAASPDIKNLRVLDLTHNALTQEGIAALQATGVKLVAKDQHDQTRFDPDEENEFLWQGDVE